MKRPSLLTRTRDRHSSRAKLLAVVLAAAQLLTAARAADPHGQAAEVRRLWQASRTLVTGHTQRLYLLGISHLGMPLEYDRYLQRVVLPAYAQADSLHFEGAPDARLDRNLPQCRYELDADPEQRALLHVLREAVVRLNKQVLLKENVAWRRVAPALPVLSEAAAGRMARSLADSDTAEELFQALANNGASLTTDPQNTSGGGQPVHVDPDTVAKLQGSSGAAALQQLVAQAATSVATPTARPDVLAGAGVPVVYHLAARRPALPLVPLDTRREVRDTFCALPAADRLHFYASRAAEIEYSVFRNNASPLAAAQRRFTVGEADQQFRRLLLNAAAARPTVVDDALLSQLVCYRNAQWIGRWNLLQPGRTDFIAVGAAHLVAQRVEGKSACAGLLTDLKQQGWEVHLLH